MFRPSLPLLLNRTYKKTHSSKGNPWRMIRVGESFWRPQNYRLAFQKFFGKKPSAEEDAAHTQKLFVRRKEAEARKRGKPESHPEVEVDHERKAGYFPKEAKALWYNRKLKLPAAERKISVTSYKKNPARLGARS
ncbi:unnamed protein product [Amoebophrya sp. A120]|nr:unnamed protein product [Amoebophrya sp. A120]|eukprot:GSA120T00000684001.1